MTSFTDMFFAIDENRNGMITLDELEEYCRKNRIDTVTVTRWRRLFDSNRTGKITFDHMCAVLGISAEDTKKDYYAKMYASGQLKVSDDVFIILRRMSVYDQVLITEQVRRLCGDFKSMDEYEVSKQLKNWLDQNYGWTWHVVILKGSHWTTFSHCYLRSLHFRIKGYTFLIWGTPVLHPENPEEYI